MLKKLSNRILIVGLILSGLLAFAAASLTHEVQQRQYDSEAKAKVQEIREKFSDQLEKLEDRPELLRRIYRSVCQKSMNGIVGDIDLKHNIAQQVLNTVKFRWEKHGHGIKQKIDLKPGHFCKAFVQSESDKIPKARVEPLVGMLQVYKKIEPIFHDTSRLEESYLGFSETIIDLPALLKQIKVELTNQQAFPMIVDICPEAIVTERKSYFKAKDRLSPTECIKNPDYTDIDYKLKSKVSRSNSYIYEITFLGQNLLVYLEHTGNHWKIAYTSSITLVFCIFLTVVLFRSVSNRESLLTEFAKKEQRNLLENEDAIKQYGLRLHSQAFAHEIKNPLAGARLALDRMVRRQEIDYVLVDSLMPDLLAVRSAFEQALEFLVEFRDGNEDIVASVRLTAVFNAVEKWARLDAEIRKIQVHIAFPEKDLLVSSHFIGLQIVLRTLLRNSAQAMATVGQCGTADIWVEIKDGCATICVADDGPGIENPDSLFLRLKSDKTDGWGLGLTKCRQFLEESGGKIKGGNHPEGGALFLVSLPLAAPTEQ